MTLSFSFFLVWPYNETGWNFSSPFVEQEKGEKKSLRETSKEEITKSDSLGSTDEYTLFHLYYLLYHIKSVFCMSFVGKPSPHSCTDSFATVSCNVENEFSSYLPCLHSQSLIQYAQL
jgi:hypothetical protein